MKNIIEYIKSKFIKKKSNDPVRVLPSRALDMIFKNIRGRDLIQMTEVNPNWNKFIGNSLQCMDRIRLNLTEYYGADKYKVLKKSDAAYMIDNRRQYRHCVINGINKMPPYMRILIGRQRWRTMKLSNYIFQSEIELVNFLGILEPFVEELVLKSVKIDRSIIVNYTEFIFPNLKKLKLLCCHNFIYNCAFWKMTGIKELEIETEDMTVYKNLSYDDQTKANGIANILINNQNITKLCLLINNAIFDRIFHDSLFLSFIGFNLEILHVAKFKHRENYNESMAGFLHFLHLHALSLKTITLENWLGNEVLEFVMNGVKELKQVTIRDIESASNNDIANLTLFPNEKIECLDIWTKSQNRYNLIKTFLKSVTPNIKILIIRSINQEILEAIGDWNSALEHIAVDQFVPYSPPEHAILPNLKTITIYNTCARNFHDVILARGSRYFTRFERIFIKTVHRAKHLQEGFTLW